MSVELERQWAEVYSQTLAEERASDTGRLRASELAMLPPAGPVSGDEDWRRGVEESLQWMVRARARVGDTYERAVGV